MKRFFTLTLTIILITCLFSCGSVKSDAPVVTTCFPLYDMASSLLGENGSVVLLLKPGQDSHSYEPSPKDVLTIKGCPLFLCIGGHDEGWVDTLLSGKDLKNVNRVSLIDTVEALAYEDGHGENDGHDHSHAYDEHIWTSPKNMTEMLETVKTSLISALPELEEEIKKNAETYRAELMLLDARLTETVSSADRDTVIFGDRFPFLHLVTDYGIKYDSAYPGCSDMTEPSAATVAHLISKIKAEGIPAVFKTQLSNGRVAAAISEQTGAKILTLHSLVNVTKTERDNGETYFSIMTKNIEALKEALGQAS